ncbi:MAG TPA: SDR family oxidoreductase [Candidatus Aminicenantes bacterium]|nr:SDR family oxidoreductase [Candidatus Aminicenantes bacterium]HRY63810.1 SDR family oxidoreductase [Candidatus Aminicenantes bacterium]HRZ70723.1 SDR family oxidoreductase [Candidatus Aminicenantes bacterium]
MPVTKFRTALITGASTGLGSEFARQLAAAGTNLVLVARRLDRLEALAGELRARHGVTVATLRADLSTPEGMAAVEARIAASPDLDLLVNNAGYGGRTGFVRGDVADQAAMIRVHIDAPVRLTKAALPGMIDRGRGAVINLASVAAFSPFSGAMYSGTKAFLVMFSENLQAGLRSKGVVVQALCPGLTHTEFHAAAGLDLSRVPRIAWMTAGKVVRISLRRLGRGVVCIPGGVNKAVTFLMRCPLTAALVRLAGRSRAVRGRSGGDKA